MNCVLNRRHAAAAFAGCGANDTNDSPAAALPETGGARAVQRQFVAGDYRRFLVTLSNVIQTSAEINSGGALVDLSVVDVPTPAALDPEFGDTPAVDIGFAIPSNTVRSVADHLISAAS